MSVRAGSSAELATQVARLFFDRRMNKVEIAQRLGITRFQVARLIDRALDDGLVRIEYPGMGKVDRMLAQAVEQQFGLDLCVVAAGGPDVGTDVVAGLAAGLIDELVTPGEIIGIAWGSTLAAVVDRIDRHAADGVAVVQLAGSSNRLDPGLEPGEVSRNLAARLGATHHPIFAPAFVDEPSIRRAILRQPDLASTVALLDRLTLAIVGVGAIGDEGEAPSSSLLRSGALAEPDIARLRALGAVGDLVVHPFDGHGRFVAPELADRAVAVDVEQLRRTRRVIAVAGGAAKAAAIRGALRTHVVGVLVTDAAAARAVIALEDRDRGPGAAGPESAASPARIANAANAPAVRSARAAGRRARR